MFNIRTLIRPAAALIIAAAAASAMAAVAEGCKAENDFRGVKPGEVRKRRCIQYPLVGEVSLPV